MNIKKSSLLLIIQSVFLSISFAAAADQCPSVNSLIKTSSGIIQGVTADGVPISYDDRSGWIQFIQTSIVLKSGPRCPKRSLDKVCCVYYQTQQGLGFNMTHR